jgi:FGFR1 oncogene partner
MAGEEDTELRDLVAQTLEAKGVLGKIRAQLRAHVFLALEEQEAEKSRPSPVNEELVSFSNTHEGRLVLGLVREFLEFYELSATLAVFEPEADVVSKQTIHFSV